MIVGRGWTWGHISKTGGDATRAMVRRLGVQCEIVPSTDQSKHRRFDPEVGRVYATNIRRLPAWVISTLKHRAVFGWFKTGAQVVTIDQTLRSPWADDWYRWITRDGQVRISWFLRMEHLEDDLVAFLRVVEGWSNDQAVEMRARLAGFPAVNAMDYDHDMWTWMTPDQVDRTYAMNPWWAENEARVYGAGDSASDPDRVTRVGTQRLVGGETKKAADVAPGPRPREAVAV